MRSYEEQYYFIRRPSDDGLPAIRPDLDTGRRHYRRRFPQPGTKPFFFDNALADDQDVDNIPWPITPPDVLIGGTDIIVKSFIRERLLEIETPGFFIFPAVYIHNDGEWYEDYWYLGFIEQFDCWDRRASQYIPDTIDGSSHCVTKYYLNKDLLDNTPLKERLLFKMGGTDEGLILCHQALAPLFRGDGESGAWLQKVSEF